MIINNSRRFIFVHVPKAAGTSLTRELARFTTFRDVEVGGTGYGEKLQDMYAARFDLRKHSTAQAIRAKAGPEVWRGYFVFAFVRDPYSRAYSLWRFLQKWREGPHHAQVAALSFEAFCADAAVQDGAIEIARPQAAWLTGPAGKLMQGIDFVGRVERLEEDLSFILSTIARRPLSAEGAMRANVSAEPGAWRAEMTDAAREAIERAYAVDFELFGYDRLAARAPEAA